MKLQGGENSNELEHLVPKYVGLTPYENCYWLNDEPIPLNARQAKPHARLVCPECESVLRLDPHQALKILEAYAERGSFDIHKALAR